MLFRMPGTRNSPRCWLPSNLMSHPRVVRAWVDKMGSASMQWNMREECVAASTVGTAA